MDTQTTLAKAKDLILNAILTAGIPGMKQTEEMLRRSAGHITEKYIDGSIFVEWGQGWTVGATLEVCITERNDGECDVLDGGSQERPFIVKCELGWCSSRYDVTTAQKVATLHTAVINLADKIERITAGFGPKAKK
jgi:hypothetical protein